MKHEGGTQIYNVENKSGVTVRRCKKTTLNFKGIKDKQPDSNGDWGTHPIMIDGELCEFKKKVVMEACPNIIEVAFSSSNYHNHKYSFYKDE